MRRTLRNVLAILVAGTVGCGADAGTTAESVRGPRHAGATSVLDAPDDEPSLVAFLAAEEYAGWAKEADYHESAGPHGKSVRVYYGPLAAQALLTGAGTFPKGAAAVKELESGGSVYGWSVWIKVEDATDGGNGFFWYERVQKDDAGVAVYGNARGSGDCVGCHRGGMDFDLSTLPFE